MFAVAAMTLYMIFSLGSHVLPRGLHRMYSEVDQCGIGIATEVRHMFSDNLNDGCEISGFLENLNDCCKIRERWRMAGH